MALASFPHAPQVSTTIGTHTHPRSEHLGLLAWFFLNSVAWAAAVADTPASNKITGFSGEVMDTSNAAVLPKNHLGSKMSAGRVLLWSQVVANFPLNPYVRPTTGLHQDVPNLLF